MTNDASQPRDEIPLAEWCVSKAVARALVWLGKRAHDRGDRHAYEHALSALRAGDCAHSGCPEASVRPMSKSTCPAAENTGDHLWLLSGECHYCPALHWMRKTSDR